MAKKKTTKKKAAKKVTKKVTKKKAVKKVSKKKLSKKAKAKTSEAAKSLTQKIADKTGLIVKSTLTYSDDTVENFEAMPEADDDMTIEEAEYEEDYDTL